MSPVLTRITAISPPFIFSGLAHHEVSWQEFLEKLSLLVLNRLDDELIIAGDIEDRSAGSRVRQLDQRLVTQRVLQGEGGKGSIKQVTLKPHGGGWAQVRNTLS